MKKRFSNHSEVCHVWAQQCQPEGSATNIYFEGRIIYSYGSHYKMAMFHGSTVLINSSGYSVSTAKHTGHVRQAVSHYATLDVPNVDPRTPEDHASNLKHFLDIIEDNQKRASRARVHGQHYQREAEQAGADHNAYIELFSLEAPAVDVSGLFSEAERERVAQQVKIETERQRERNRQRALELKEKFDAWKTGADVDAWQFRALPVALRIIKKYEDQRAIVETSHGASVDVLDAVELLEKLDAGADVKGYSIGHYTVTSWNGKILTIGCHKIPRSEIERVRLKLSLYAEMEPNIL